MLISVVCVFIFTHVTLASVGISCCHVSVCPSVTSQCSTEMAKHRITQTTPHDSHGTVVLRCQKSLQNSNGVTASAGAKCRWGRLNVVIISITRYHDIDRGFVERTISWRPYIVRYRARTHVSRVCCSHTASAASASD